jgi:hypothetical protein
MKFWSFALLVLCAGRISAAQELEQLLSRAQSSSGLWAHLDGAVLMKGNQPVCAFGVRQIGDEPAQYTYFVLFRTLPKSDEEFVVNGPLRSKGGSTNYTVAVAVGKKKIEIAHKMEVDETTKKLTTDELRVGGEAIKPEASRVFVVDLSADPPTVKPVAIKPPATVISPRSDEGHLDAIKKITAEYLGGSDELQKLLRAP